MTAAMGIALACSAGLLAIWAGYPLVVAAWAAALGRRAGTAARPGVRVSVVLATREAPAAIRARVEDLLVSHDRACLEVIVSLDTGAPPIDEGALALPAGVHLVRGDGPAGKASALNAGVRAATGDVLVFTDTAQRFGPATVGLLVEALARPGVGAASGALVLPDEAQGGSVATRYWRYEKWLRANEARVHSTIGVTGAVWAMPRALWVPLPPDCILDDVHTPMRLVLAGHRVDFVRDARAYETRRTSSAAEYKRKVRTLTGVLQLCRSLPVLLVPVRNPVWIQFVCHKLLRLLTPYLVLGLCLSGTVALVELARAAGAAWLLVATVAGLLIAARLAAPRALRGATLGAASLLAAAVAGTANGLRGRWNVWHQR